VKSAANTSWPAANIQKQGKRTNATGNRLTQAVKALSVSHEISCDSTVVVNSNYDGNYLFTAG